MRVLLSTFILAIFISCGDNSTTSINTNITIEKVAAVAAGATGGIMLYGMSDDGDTFGRSLATTDITVQLPNKTWTFYAVSWDNTGLQAGGSGNNKCFESLPEQLTGGQFTINIDLSSAACNTNSFKQDLGNVGANDLGPLQDIVSCKSLNPAAGPVTGFGDDARCNYAETNNFNKGYFTSFKIILPSFDKFGGTFVPRPGALQSNCYQLPANPNPVAVTAAVNAVLPFSRTPKPFFTKVRGFFGPNNSAPSCSDSDDRGFSDINFPFGLGATTSSFVSGSNDTIRLFVTSNIGQICQGPRLSNPGSNFFASGGGDVARAPMVICSEQQWNNVAANWGTVKDYDFELGNNLDFNYQSTFEMFGAPAGDPGVSAFTGNFLGNNHSIVEIFHQQNDGNSSSADPQDAYVGLFRAIDTTGMPNVIKDLRLYHTFFSCNNDFSGACEKVGGLIGGIMTGSTGYTNIKNVEIKNVRIEGQRDVGGVIGEGINPILKDVHVKADIESFNGRAGGLIGDMNFSNQALTAIELSSFDGKVLVRTGADAGGLVGSTGGDLTMTHNKSRGIIRATNGIGGLIGAANGTGTVSYNYSTANLSTDIPTGAADMGGLIGVLNGLTLIKNFHVLGSVAPTNYAVTNVGSLVGNISTGSCDASNMASHKPLVSAPTTGTCNLVSPFTNAQMRTIGTYTGITPGWTNNAASSDLNATSGTENFVMVDGDDFPRLFWENPRECEGHYGGSASGVGSGSAADPILICTANQLLAVSGGAHYELGGDIDLNPTSLAPTVTNSFVLNLDQVIDGNDHYINDYHFEIPNTGAIQAGLFQTINTNGVLRDIIFTGIRLEPNGTRTANDNLEVGLIAHNNLGTIDNVEVWNSTARLFSDRLTPGAAPAYKFSSFVFSNSNTISDVISRTHLVASANDISSVSMELAGLVHTNSGTLQNSSYEGAILFGDGFYSAGTDDGVGAVAFTNTGTGVIRETGAYGIIETNMPAAFGTRLSGFVVDNAGSIFDSQSQVGIINDKDINSGGVAGFVYNNTGGSVLRSIVRRPFTAHNMTGAATIRYGFVHTPGGGAISESFCALEPLATGFNGGSGLAQTSGTDCVDTSTITISGLPGNLNIQDTGATNEFDFPTTTFQITDDPIQNQNVPWMGQNGVNEEIELIANFNLPLPTN